LCPQNGCILNIFGGEKTWEQCKSKWEIEKEEKAKK
jgi:hypothetical protein